MKTFLPTSMLCKTQREIADDINNDDDYKKGVTLLGGKP